MSDRLVLVTGGTGYLGSALVPEIAKRYPVRVYCNFAFGNSIEGTPNVEFIKGDIRDYRSVAKAMHGVTDVIHLAGIVTDELVDMNPKLGEQVNDYGTRIVLSEAYKADVGRFLYASSSSVYGSQDFECTEETIPKPQTAYAQSKLDGENEVLSYKGRMTVCALRMATLCGPAPRMRLDTIVNVFSKQAFYDGKITVFDGRQWRCNVFIDDAVAFWVALLDVESGLINGEVFNFLEKARTATDIAEIVRKAYDVAYGGFTKIEIDISKVDDRHYRMSSEKALRILNFGPANEGVRQAALMNFKFFSDHLEMDPNDDLYYNTRRMAEAMKQS